MNYHINIACSMEVPIIFHYALVKAYCEEVYIPKSSTKKYSQRYLFDTHALRTYVASWYHEHLYH